MAPTPIMHKLIDFPLLPQMVYKKLFDNRHMTAKNVYQKNQKDKQY